ncbi:uncharacterized protein LOC111105486 isoform X2 [Crassostrea virginica]
MFYAISEIFQPYNGGMCFKNSVWTLILFLVDVRLSISLCQGIFKFQPCCTGERWDSDKMECVPCPSDHYGKNCTFTCNVPYDGYRCVIGGCTCNKLACNVEISSPECFNAPEPEPLSKFITSTTEVQTEVKATEKSTSRFIYHQANKLILTQSTTVWD